MVEARTTSSGDVDRRARNRRIRALRDSDRTEWTLGRLAREFSISKPRVAEILAAEPSEADRDVALLERELRLRAEYADLLERRRHRLDVVATAEVRRRLRVVGRLLSRIEEERESREIDRLLGLA